MATYISILRGINVSGYKMIKMDALRQSCVALGFENVKTYIQSGNIVFNFRQTDNKKLSSKIAGAIKTTFGFDVPVLVMDIDELRQILKNNPFLKDKSKEFSFLHVTFLSDKPKQEYVNDLINRDFSPDCFHLASRSIYLYCPNGYSNSKLTNTFLESKLKVTATTRNWKTTNELVAIAEKM
jgi:uncharacterized protein (DUF1697 family)